VTHKCRSTTDDASVALLFIAAENNILNDFQFLGCFIWSNYPLQITIRCINGCITCIISSSRETMWVLFAILRVNNSFSYRIFQSILVLVIISQLTLVSKLFLGGPVIEGEDGPTEVNALIQWKTFVWTISWSYLSSDSHHAKRILEFICWMVSLSLHYGSINQGRRHREVNSSIPSS
jgi:hypothetical protein